MCLNRKRYERAEKEFVEAKMVLAEKSDLKESLTEHLYTIIQQNEVRKAERLAVLMKELGLEAEDCPNTLSSVPPLLSFSPINTLHRPSAPSTPTAIAVSPTATQPVQSPVEEAGGESEKQSPEGEKEKETGHSEDVNADITGGANGEGSSEAASETAQDKSPDSKGPDRTVEADSKVTTKAPVENGAVESQDGGAEPAAAPSTWWLTGLGDQGDWDDCFELQSHSFLNSSSKPLYLLFSVFLGADPEICWSTWCGSVDISW